MNTRNSITNFKRISDKKNARSSYKYNIENVSNYFLIIGTLSGLRQLLAIESPLKMMKNAFLFHLKSSFRSQDI